MVCFSGFVWYLMYVLFWSEDNVAPSRIQTPRLNSFFSKLPSTTLIIISVVLGISTISLSTDLNILSVILQILSKKLYDTSLSTTLIIITEKAFTSK